MNKIQTITLLLATALSLSACNNPKQMFESKTYGINNSQWANMSKSERYAAKEAYREQQYLAEQRRLNAELVREKNVHTRLGQK